MADPSLAKSPAVDGLPAANQWSVRYSAKYTPSGGAIMLRVRRRSSGEVEISVTDTGPGIPPEDRTRRVRQCASGRRQAGRRAHRIYAA